MSARLLLWSIDFPHSTQLWQWIHPGGIPLPHHPQRHQTQLLCLFLHAVPHPRHLALLPHWHYRFPPSSSTAHRGITVVVQGHNLLLFCTDFHVCDLQQSLHLTGKSGMIDLRKFFGLPFQRRYVYLHDAYSDHHLFPKCMCTQSWTWGGWWVTLKCCLRLSPLVFPVVPLLVATHTALLKTETVGCGHDGNYVVYWSGKLTVMSILLRFSCYTYVRVSCACGL